MPRLIRLDYDPTRPRPASRWRNEPVAEDGHVFDSKAERDYYRELRVRELAGEITQLRVHPRYHLNINDQRIGDYIADFDWKDAEGRRHVQDVKGGPLTAVFSLKRKLMLALFGIHVEIIRR